MASRQHPRQMLFIFASSFGSSARISASPGIDGPGVTVPSMRLPRALPVVDPARPAPDPVEVAVPAVLVPGGAGVIAALPAPLRSPELFVVFAGAVGAPPIAALPVSAAPALGEPAAVPLPVLGFVAPVVEAPVVAPPVEVPVVAPPAAAPVAAPPAEPPLPDPPPPPPPLCANEASGLRSAATITHLARNWFCIACLCFDGQRRGWELVPKGDSELDGSYRCRLKVGFARPR